MNRFRYIIAGVVIVLIFLSGLFYTFILNREPLIVDIGKSQSISLYEPSGKSEEAPEYDHNKKPKIIINKNGTYSIPKGMYTYLTNVDKNQYQPQQGQIMIDKPSQIKVVLEYTATKNISEYNSISSAVESILVAKYPLGMQSYHTSSAHFYNGSYLGILLVPNDPNRDLLRVIFKRQGSKLIIATDPPSISLSKPVYSDIPKNILDSVNDLSI